MQLRAAARAEQARPSADRVRPQTVFKEDFEDGLGGWTPASESVVGGPTRRGGRPRPPAGNAGRQRRGPSGPTRATAPATRATTPASTPSSARNQSARPATLAPAHLRPQHPDRARLGRRQRKVSLDGGPFTLSRLRRTSSTRRCSTRRRPATPTRSKGRTASPAPTAASVSDWGTSIMDLAAAGVPGGDTDAGPVRLRTRRLRRCRRLVRRQRPGDQLRCRAASTTTATHTPEPSTFGSSQLDQRDRLRRLRARRPVTVTVKEGATTIGTGTLNGSGHATVPLPASTPVGVHNLTVNYAGNGTYDVSTGNVTATVVAKPATSSTDEGHGAEEGQAEEVRSR